MRKGKQKVRLSNSVTEIDGNNVAVVRKTKRSTAGRSKPKILERDPLALPKSPRGKEKATKSKSKTKVKAVPTKAARKQPVEEEYEVQEIVAHRPVGCDMSYRIRWKGWGPKDDTWQLEHELSCDAILKKYKDAIRTSGKSSSSASSATPKKRGRPSTKGSPVKKKGVASGRVTKKGRGRPPKSAETGSPKKKKSKPSGRPKKEWEVEEVVAVRKTEKGKEEFLIKWKGYGTDENTWEPAKNVANCTDAITKFKEQQGDEAVTNGDGDAAADKDEEDADKDDEEEKAETSGKDEEEVNGEEEEVEEDN